MNALDLLKSRGFIEWTSDEKGLHDLFEQGMQTVYVGFDPTADSLHVGHLVPMMALAWLQKGGHRPVLLAGGGTGMIGDPSGKSKERNLLTAETTAQNVEAIKKQLAKLVDFDCGPKSAVLVNNYDWLGKLNLIEFLRDVGKHYTVNYMIRKEHVRSRIEDPSKSLSFTEFTYTILQGYDFWHLFHELGCRVQMGGNDQQGNLVSGIELIRKQDGETAFAATSPLLLNSSGTKFGKTEDGALWLDPARTSPYRFYQFWVNAEDGAVEKLLNLFTFVPGEEIARLMEEQRQNSGARPAQKRLAYEVTALIHGAEAAAAARRASDVLFGAEAGPLDEATLAMVAEETALVEAPVPSLLTELLVSGGLTASKAEAKRLMTGGGLTVGGEKVTDPSWELTADRFGESPYLLLRLGKKKYAVLKRV